MPASYLLPFLKPMLVSQGNSSLHLIAPVVYFPAMIPCTTCVLIPLWSCVCLCFSAEDSLLRQDDIWMLDGDEPQEPLSCVTRPDHLDFLRITPPEDDIIGDTPYYPRLECTVRKLQHNKHQKITISWNAHFCSRSSASWFFPPPPSLLWDS